MTYRLTHGIHRGTITSRDIAEPETFETEQAAIDRLNEHEKFYRSIGYVIWFAELERPDKTKVALRSNSNYR